MEIRHTQITGIRLITFNQTTVISRPYQSDGRVVEVAKIIIKVIIVINYTRQMQKQTII